MNRGVLKAGKKLDAEGARYLDIICSSGAMLLWEDGWRKTRISRLLAHMSAVYHECAQDRTGKSILQMVENETGIEIQSPNGKSWHDYAYLNSDIWDGKPARNPAMQIMIWTRMLEWIEPQMRGALYLALHRKEGWGFDKLAAFSQRLDILRAELGEKASEYAKALEERTEFDIVSLYTWKVKDVERIVGEER